MSSRSHQSCDHQCDTIETRFFIKPHFASASLFLILLTGFTRSSTPRVSASQEAPVLVNMFSFHSAITLAVLVFTAIASTTDAVPVQLYGLNYNTRKGADWNPTDLKCKTYYQTRQEF